MNENVDLIKDVADLRDAVKKAKEDFSKVGGTKELDKLKAQKERLTMDS